MNHVSVLPNQKPGGEPPHDFMEYLKWTCFPQGGSPQTTFFVNNKSKEDKETIYI